MAMVTTLAGLTIPVMASALDALTLTRAITDIKVLQTEITRFEVVLGKPPNSLDELGIRTFVDPWGNPYQYLSFANAAKDQHWGGSEGGTGKPRKDRFLVPLNSSYDLYSLGEDGESDEDLQADKSQDDVIRANDGMFIGLARQY